MSVLPTLRLLRDVALALCLAWILGLGMATQPLAQTPAVETTSTPVSPEPPSPNDVREFRRLLADPKIQHWLTEEASKSDEGAAASAVSLREQFGHLVAKVRERVVNLRLADGQDVGRSTSCEF